MNEYKFSASIKQRTVVEIQHIPSRFPPSVSILIFSLLYFLFRSYLSFQGWLCEFLLRASRGSDPISGSVFPPASWLCFPSASAQLLLWMNDCSPSGFPTTQPRENICLWEIPATILGFALIGCLLNQSWRLRGHSRKLKTLNLRLPIHFDETKAILLIHSGLPCRQCS